VYEDYGIVLCSLVASNVKTVRCEIMAAVRMDMVFRSTVPCTLVESNEERGPGGTEYKQYFLDTMLYSLV
jgi:hypothetical protein